MDRMLELVELLNTYAKEYYEYDNPTVSDAEYDALYDELVNLESDTGIVLPDSPTKKVGGASSRRFKAYTHRERLYSLDKSKTKEGVHDWIAKLNRTTGGFVSLTLEYKYDGLTINLTYSEGRLITAATRGDGIAGEVVTEQIKTIKSIPHTIPFKGYVEILGECIMRLSVLSSYNENAVEQLKNARNAAAGGVRNLNPEETAKRNLDFFAYGVGYYENIAFRNQEEIRGFLVNNGFTAETYFEVISKEEEIDGYLDRAEEARPHLDYLIDGMVLKVNDLPLRDILGYTEKFPRWALAYKFKAEEVVSRVLDVIWQVSRTGKINPLAVLEPVDIGGALVKRATLSNYSEIIRKDIKIGSDVFVRRSGDVIPEILGVARHNPQSRPVEKPQKCPSCGSDVVEKGVFLYCSEPDRCAPRIISQIEHFAAKDALDIEGLSTKTIEQLYNDLNVNSVDLLYDLTRKELLTLEGFKDKKADNLINAIKRSKKTTLQRFILGIGIPNVGKKAAKQLEIHFKTLNRIRAATAQEILAINDFGEISANAITEYFANEGNVRLIDSLLSKGFEFESKPLSEGVFSGKVVVLTGSLERYKRSAAAKEIEERGGEVADSISSRVNLVVAGSDAGSKLDKARKLNIEVIDEAAFIELLEARA